MDIAELIARVEAATGPDRKLDAMIWALTLPRGGEGLDGYGLPDGARYEYRHCEDGRVDQLVVLAEGYRRVRANRPSPAFTASLDATISLVEKELPGWVWNAGGTGPDGLCFAIMVHRVDHNRRTRARHHTPPLALLRAFLLTIQNKAATDA